MAYGGGEKEYIQSFCGETFHRMKTWKDEKMRG
jgi:hypothetical protein